MAASKNVHNDVEKSQRWLKVLEASPVPKAINDDQQNITFLNKAFVETFGYTLEDIPTLADWWPKAYPDPAYREAMTGRWTAELKRAQQTGTTFTPIEVDIRCKNGSQRCVLASAALFGNPSEHEHLVVLYDITERRQAEERLRQLEQRQALALAASEVGLWDWNLLTNHMLLDDHWCAITGHKTAEVEQHLNGFYSLLNPDDRGRVDQAIASQFQNVDVETQVEFRLRHKAGHWVWVQTRGRIMEWDSSGRPTRMLGTTTDISERKKNEQALSASESLNSAILNSLGAHIAVLDSQGNIVAVNDAWRRFQAENSAPETLVDQVGMNYLDACRNSIGSSDSEDAAMALHGINVILAGERSEFSFEYPCETESELRWFNMRVTPLLGGQGGAVVSHEDVTERVRSIKAREESDRYLRIFADTVPATISYWDTALVNQFASQGYRRYFALGPQEMKGKHISQVIGPEMYAESERDLRLALAGQTRQWERRIAMPSGKKLHVLGNYFPDLLDGVVQGIFAVTIDVTELFSSQEQVRLLQTAVARLNDIVLVTETGDTDGRGDRVSYVNDAFTSITGFTWDEVVGIKSPIQHVDDNDAAGRERIRLALLAGQTVRSEMQILAKDGRLIWVDSQIVPIADAHGKVTNHVSILQDMTDRRQADQALRDRTDQYQRANEALQQKQLALREVLASMEAEKKLIGDRVVANVEKVILPLVRTLREGTTHTQQKVVQQIEAGLEQVLSPFTQLLAKHVASLSPAELTICHLIRNGLGVKQIAEIEHLSPETVSVHRRNIRRKLGISHKKLNLATYLATFLSVTDA